MANVQASQQSFIGICCRHETKQLFNSNPQSQLSGTIRRLKRLNSVLLIRPIHSNRPRQLSHRCICVCLDLRSNAELVFMRPWDMAFVAFNPLITLWPPTPPSTLYCHSCFSSCSIPSHFNLSAYSFSSPAPAFLVKPPSVTDFRPLTWQVNSRGPGVVMHMCTCVCSW